MWGANCIRDFSCSVGEWADNPMYMAIAWFSLPCIVRNVLTTRHATEWIQSYTTLCSLVIWHPNLLLYGDFPRFSRYEVRLGPLVCNPVPQIWSIGVCTDKRAEKLVDTLFRKAYVQPRANDQYAIPSRLRKSNECRSRWGDFLKR